MTSIPPEMAAKVKVAMKTVPVNVEPSFSPPSPVGEGGAGEQPSLPTQL